MALRAASAFNRLLARSNCVGVQVPIFHVVRGFATVKYTKTHEYAKIADDQTVTFGITKSAVEHLGEIVFVDLPDVGADLKTGETALAIESVKAVADVVSPADGVVTEVNEQLRDNLKLICDDPEGAGWIAKMKASNVPANLMDEATYKTHCESEEH